jgi:hypothetical protein
LSWWISELQAVVTPSCVKFKTGGAGMIGIILVNVVNQVKKKKSISGKLQIIVR